MTVQQMPNGLLFEIRPGTTDWNTVNACMVADEYELADVAVERALVFDIGAHVGGVGVWLATRGAQVICVEPVHANAWQVSNNAALNGVENRVTVVEAAIGTDTISLGPEGDAHEFIANPTGGDGMRPVEVVQVSFSALVEAYGAPSIVKLDCEGGEWAAFKDDALRSVPLIVGEYHDDFTGSGCTAADIARLLPEHAVQTTGTPTFGAFRAELRGARAS